MEFSKFPNNINLQRSIQFYILHKNGNEIMMRMAYLPSHIQIILFEDHNSRFQRGQVHKNRCQFPILPLLIIQHLPIILLSGSIANATGNFTILHPHNLASFPRFLCVPMPSPSMITIVFFFNLPTVRSDICSK